MLIWLKEQNQSKAQKQNKNDHLLSCQKQQLKWCFCSEIQKEAIQKYHAAMYIRYFRI